MQTDVGFNQQRMHSHSDAEPELQEEISSVWTDTGRVARCSDEEGIERLEGCRWIKREREMRVHGSHFF